MKKGSFIIIYETAPILQTHQTLIKRVDSNLREESVSGGF